MKIISFLLIVLATCANAEYYFTGPIDYTLWPTAKGSEVVQAVVQKLDASEVFSNDYLFLRRLAFVQTRDGTMPGTYQDPYFYGGIWGVDEETFNATKSPDLNPQHQGVLRVFGIRWRNVKWVDLRKPIYSGLAARLFLTSILPQGVPKDINEQAVIWIKYFYSEDRQINILGQAIDPSNTSFVRVIERQRENETCAVGKVDLILLMDGSGSVGVRDFKRAMDFVEGIVEPLTVHTNGARVGMAQYSGTARVEFYLRQHLNKPALLNAIRRVKYKGGTTRTGFAINYVFTRMFVTRRGARRLSELVPRILIVVTDGQSHDNVFAASRRAHLSGINVFAVGVTEVVNRNELVTIASGLESTHVFEIANFRALKFVQSVLQSRTCTEAAVWPLDQTQVKGVFLPGEEKHLKIEVTDIGITLRLETEDGSMLMLGSTWITDPNEALHDFLLNITNDMAEVFFNPFDLQAGWPVRNQTAEAVISSISGRPALTLFMTLVSKSTYPVDVTLTQQPGNQLIRAPEKIETATPPRDVLPTAPPTTSAAEITTTTRVTTTTTKQTTTTPTTTTQTTTTPTTTTQTTTTPTTTPTTTTQTTTTSTTTTQTTTTPTTTTQTTTEEATTKWVRPPFRYERGCYSDAYIVEMPRYRSDRNWAKVNLPMPSLRAMTICVWIRSELRYQHSAIFSYAVPEEDNEILFYLHPLEGFHYRINDDKFSGGRPMFPQGRWCFVCVSWEGATGESIVYLDGRPIQRSRHKHAHKHVIRGGGSLMLGAEQDCVPGCFEYFQQFIGGISTLNVWSYVLNRKEMKIASTCRQVFGDVMHVKPGNVIVRGKYVQKNLFNWCQICPRRPRYFGF